MLSFAYLLKVSRLRFWVYVFGPYLIGLVAGTNFRESLYDWKILAFGLFFLFPANLLIYGVNDIFDYETDKLNEKKVDYESLVEPNLQKKLFVSILIFNLPFIVASFFFGAKATIAMLGFLFFSCFYSAPPIRAKAKPTLDSAFNILYVFPGIFSYVLVSDDYPPLFIIVAAGLWTMAMHAYSAIPDIEADRAAKLHTIATLISANGTLIVCLILYVSSAFIAYFYLGKLAILFGTVYAAMIFISLHFNKSNKLFKIYRFFPLVNSVVGFVLFWYIALFKFYK